jgi:hypothetical protein
MKKWKSEKKMANPCLKKARFDHFSSGTARCFSSIPDLETKCEIRVDDFTRAME